MNILVIQPGFPAEIPYFTRGLKRVGATVLGLGDQPEYLLPEVAKSGLDAYLRVPNMWNSASTIEALRRWNLPLKLDRVECLWEPGMMLAAEIRKAFGLAGMDGRQTTLFRDKELMKRALDRAGIRTPRHVSAKTQTECRMAARTIGYPLIIKPIAGAGSANTYKVADQAAFEAILPRLNDVVEVSIEEYIEGREYTFDTICVDGEVKYYNIALYRPNVLEARSVESLSPQTVTLRQVDTPELEKGHALGLTVLKALGFQTGFTHMEWFLTKGGEAVFGEIAARPPGGRSVELMNYGCDMDVFEGWAEAVVHGRLRQDWKRAYNAAVIFKRARGQGRISKIKGLTQIYSKYADHIVCNNLSPIGAARRNWKQTLVSDGYLIVRHPDLDQTVAMADYIAENLILEAG